MKNYPWDYRNLFDYKTRNYSFEITDFLANELDKLKDPVKDFLTVVIEGKISELIYGYLNKCESPIEQLLVIALDYFIGNDPDVFMIVQNEIKLQHATYRVDICVYIGDWMENIAECKKLVIECDGHDFHEKTKEQAMRDKKRDRDLIEAGYQVIHFTGSEIFADPFKCAREIRDLINKMR
ncbi:conserved hypothetical protein [Caldicellulosiruptor hydrothermalis 108]|uniref:DUF559 domain-containing protein n=1 Tax=Caldicellulosiruptor hydrothermalis (strain DSM 18901 / VKM B-2411 / 108) TaxID=632292 RepID=E4QDS0_CALH1|nr:DUF559 domain-containing protein [Caldicellulosiruptor hydrothermalis]ADQ06487.1 conserved hypothetical protein [Caldicellulosiruptor hydrothermalis 108]